jgi:hydroxymethylbilane synthase
MEPNDAILCPLSTYDDNSMQIRLGTRQSQLALWQANHVSSLLEREGHSVELVKITTSGDVSTTPLGASGGIGVFTKEIQRALLDKTCDLAVHSLKDLPTEPVPGLVLASVPDREDAADAFLSVNYSSLLDLPEGAKIGTGSPRRKAQLLRLRPDLEVMDIRGNVDTRIRKLDAGEYDAIILACAGLHRLQLSERVTHRFSFDEMLPAVGQAALGLETREEDEELRNALMKLDHSLTHLAVVIERTLLRAMRAGCLAPLAAHAVFDGETVRLTARVFSMDYSEMIEQYWSWPATRATNVDQAAQLGTEAARDLCELGADKLIHGEEESEDNSDES